MFILKNYSNGTVVINKYNTYQQIEIPSGKHFNLGDNLSPEEIKIYKNYYRIGLHLVFEDNKSYLKPSDARPELRQPVTPIAPFVPTTPVVDTIKEVKPEEVQPIVEEIKGQPQESAMYDEQSFVKEVPVTEDVKTEEVTPVVEDVKTEEVSDAPKSDKKKKK